MWCSYVEGIKALNTAEMVSEVEAAMISFAFRFGELKGAFTTKQIFSRRLGRATSIPRSHRISTINNAKLWYLKPLQIYQTEKPYHINLPANAIGSHAQSNEVSQEYAGIRIQDLRGFEDDFTLDGNGFQVFGNTDCDNCSAWPVHSGRAAPVSDAYDDPNIVRENYYPAIERFLKDKLGAQSAKAFTHDVWLPPYLIGRCVH